MTTTITSGLTLEEAQLHRILAVAEQGYPEEVCGILIGRPARDGGRPQTVVRIVETANAATDDRRRRYVVPPADLVREQRAARADGLDMIGFYHSHPGHPAVPSAHDLELAWPWYAYVIVSVTDGTAGEVRVWRLERDRSRFTEHTLIAEPAP